MCVTNKDEIRFSAFDSRGNFRIAHYGADTWPVVLAGRSMHTEHTRAIWQLRRFTLSPRLIPLQTRCLLLHQI